MWSGVRWWWELLLSGLATNDQDDERSVGGWGVGGGSGERVRRSCAQCTWLVHTKHYTAASLSYYTAAKE